MPTMGKQGQRYEDSKHPARGGAEQSGAERKRGGCGAEAKRSRLCQNFSRYMSGEMADAGGHAACMNFNTL